MHDYKKYGNKVLAMYFISSTELINPTTDIKPTSLQGVAKRIIWQQQCRVYVNCRICQFCSTFYSHALKPTSLFHLEEIFLLSLVCILFKGDPSPNNLTTPTATQHDSFSLFFLCILLTVRSSILMLST